MRVIAVTALLAALSSVAAGCSGAASPATTGTEPTAEAPVEQLTPLWHHDLVLSVTARGAEGQGAVSQGHLLASGTVDNSPGTVNPTPNVQLDYGLADAETGEVVVVPPLGGGPSVVRAVPGTDRFVAVSKDLVGVLDASTATWLWRGRARIGTEVVGVTADRIWMGRTAQDGRPVCFATDTGEIVRHDPACREAESASGGVVTDDVRVLSEPVVVELPDLTEVTVPRFRAVDQRTGEILWTYGATSVAADGVEDLGYETATFAATDLGLVRVDYRREPAPASSGVTRWARATLRLVDPRTGEVVRTLGRIAPGVVVGFAGDVAIVEHPFGDQGTQAAGYRLR